METAIVNQKLEIIPDGSVTTPRGFSAGAVHVGVRTDWDKLDVGIVASEVPCVAAATYTQNRAARARRWSSAGAPRQRARRRRSSPTPAAPTLPPASRAWTTPSRWRSMAGRKLGIDPHDVVVASTGVIGTLPADGPHRARHRESRAARGRRSRLRERDHDDRHASEARCGEAGRLDDRRCRARASA